ncbi:heavy metal translocating P-type ATPase [Variovorax terrae]|uniref:Heavy metal translocating P-type ATPase n=1 Tax=Variovorax terrae TaxID=2923278 RepID=A0A9X2AQ84_9BURK|nr:heavy metal translocating P-type ATPase [Variovorax terrae]MCJ0762891.1 heavy metal translocating P-type ATPase [Variovorax terrae]
MQAVRLPAPPAIAPGAGALSGPQDDATDWTAFSRPIGEAGQPQRWESQIVIEGMHCAACPITIEQALCRVPGVESAEVSAAGARARVVWRSAEVQPAGWLGAIRRAGYRAWPATDAFAQDRRRRQQRLMLWRWLVAGFCMMQVMMYAVPAYVAAPGEITPDIEQLLRWASWVLTLPVVLFSCGPFFASAARDLAQRRIGMDLPVALGIVIAFAASTAATFSPDGWWGREVWFDSLTMFVFFLLTGRWLEQRLKDRTAGALDALMQRLPLSVERLEADGSFRRVAIHRLAPGDVVRVLPGEAFPADGVLTDGETLADEALLTGESRPVPKFAGAPVIAGSYNLSAPARVRIERVGQDTRYAGIVALMEQASFDKPRLAVLADRVARPFLALVLLAGAAAAAWWWPSDPARAVMAAVAVLIVTCPCALSLATPAAMLAAAGSLARRGVLVRRLQALEALAGIDTVVFDKTGTLTQDRMALNAIRARAGVSPDKALCLAAALARHSLHPASRALAAAAAMPLQATDVKETMGQGLSGQVLDPSQPASPLRLRLGSAGFCGLPAGPRPGGVLQVHLSSDAGWLATFELEEALRPEALAAVQALREAGVQVQLLSGDRQWPVQRMARCAGIAQAFGECLPQDKLAHVQALQRQGRRVAMVGDGLNDGPVLACADVSVAMGQGVPLAQAQADFVVQGGQLLEVPHLLRQARRTLRIVRQNLLWAALYNALCVPLALMGWLPAWAAGLGMAASSLLVVLNALRLARAEGGG